MPYLQNYATMIEINQRCKNGVNYLRRNKMTDAQIFQILGIVYLAVGIGVLINPSFYRNLLAALSEHPPAVYLSGLISLGIGFLLVTFHNIWTADDWTVIITILGWVALIKGVLLVITPNVMIKMCKVFDNQMKKFFLLWAAILIIAGALLAWLGFYGL